LRSRRPDLAESFAAIDSRLRQIDAVGVRLRNPYRTDRRRDYRALDKGRYRAGDPDGYGARLLFGLLPHLLRVVFLHFRVKAREATLVRIVEHQARLL
jgi:hypothetical protein